MKKHWIFVQPQSICTKTSGFQYTEHLSIKYFLIFLFGFKNIQRKFIGKDRLDGFPDLKS